jgi:hypothetical protein
MDVGRPGVFCAVAVLGALLVAGLVLVLRGLARRVALDDAEAVLRAEFEGDDGRGTRCLR